MNLSGIFYIRRCHMFYPDLTMIRQLAADGTYKTAPVSMEILSDIRTPIEVMRIL